MDLEGLRLRVALTKPTWAGMSESKWAIVSQTYFTGHDLVFFGVFIANESSRHSGKQKSNKTN